MSSEFENITTEEIKHADFPLIRRYENLLTANECQQIIEHGQPRLKRSLTGNDKRKDSGRNSSQVWMKSNELPCLERVSNFVAKETKLPVENQEGYQLVHYEVGQEFKNHYDDCAPITPRGGWNVRVNAAAIALANYETCVANRRMRGWGARVYTFFIYLNDVLEGGETCFPKLDFSFKPEQGTAILWGNLTEDGLKTHPYSLHAGAPITKGEKWAMNVWVRESPEKINDFYKWI